MMQSRALRPWMLAGLLLLLPGIALADDLQKNADLLRSAPDFRVRTQAALALGASGQLEAVTPLCQGVGDDHRVVRIASATALSRLGRGGSGCIENRLKTEPDGKVKAALQKALAHLLGGHGATSAEPAIGSQTRFYVAIDKLHGPERLNVMLRAAFVRGTAGDVAVAIAPSGEKTVDAERTLKQHPHAKGFMLSATAPKPVYAGGQLKVKLSLAIMTYPDRAIVGTFSQNLAMTGIAERDEAAETELLVAAAESAMKKFIQLAPTLDP